MKIIFDYLSIKIDINKIKYIILFIFIYGFIKFVEVIFGRYNYNFYDIIIEQFGYLNLFYFISFTFLLVICNICSNTIYNNYLYTRFTSKINIYNINIICILFISIFFIAFINIQGFLECIFKISFKNQWSDYFFYNIQSNTNAIYNTNHIANITNNITPITYVIITNLLVIITYVDRKSVV